MARDAQLQATANLLSALQLLVRRMINLSYLSPEASADHASPVVAAFHEATVEWNKALYGALLVAPPGVAAEIPDLDREVDRLVDLAISRVWTRSDFRSERTRLGAMAAAHLKLARSVAGLPDIDLRSIWAWDNDPSAASPSGYQVGQEQPAAAERIDLATP